MNHLLVVDADPAIVAMFEHIFSGSEIVVSSRKTCAAALDFVSNQKPDAILLDLVLPDGDAKILS